MRRAAALGVVLCLAFAGQVRAAGEASDDASNYSGGTWTNEANGGSGFGPWTLTFSGNSGNFLGSSTDNGDGSGPGIDTGGQSWGLWANSGGETHGYRPFTFGDLQVNQQFEIDFDNGWVQDGGSVGLGLQNSSGDNLWEFYFFGGQDYYKINDLVAHHDSFLPFTDDGLSLLFTLTGPTSYTFSVTVKGGTTSNYTGYLISQADQGIERAHIWNYNAGPDAQRNGYWNSMSVVPEPVTVGLIILGIGGLLTHLRRRR